MDIKKKCDTTFYLEEQVDCELLKKWIHLNGGFEETTEQNIVENNEISNLLSILSLTADELCHGDLKVLKGEDVNDLDELSLRHLMITKKIAERNATRESLKLKSENKQIFEHYNSLDEKLQQLITEVLDLESSIQDEHNSTENEATNESLMENKISMYKNKIEEMTNDIQEINYIQLNPSNILMKSDKYVKKMAEQLQLETELCDYFNLPPDLYRAKLAIDQKKQEYEETMKQLDQKLG